MSFQSMVEQLQIEALGYRLKEAKSNAEKAESERRTALIIEEHARFAFERIRKEGVGPFDPLADARNKRGGLD